MQNTRNTTLNSCAVGKWVLPILRWPQKQYKKDCDHGRPTYNPSAPGFVFVITTPGRKQWTHFTAPNVKVSHKLHNASAVTSFAELCANPSTIFTTFAEMRTINDVEWKMSLIFIFPAKDCVWVGTRAGGPRGCRQRLWPFCFHWKTGISEINQLEMCVCKAVVTLWMAIHENILFVFEKFRFNLSNKLI